MNKFDLFLIRALESRAMDVHPDPHLLIRIKAEYNQRKEHPKMKSGMKKIIAIAAVLCLLTASCYAAVQYAVIESRSGRNITGFAELADAEKEVGFDAKYVESFANGFRFDCGGTGTNIDAEGAETRFLTISYRNRQKQDLMLHIDTIGSGTNGYFTQVCKFVPQDYQPTAEDLAREKSGELMLSYGTDEIEIQTYESYSWQDGGLFYSLGGFDLNMGEAQLKAMADEIG